MTRLDELNKQRQKEAARIKNSLSSMQEKIFSGVKEGEEVVAFVSVDQCIGCDQCILICDDKAIELYDVPLSTPALDIEINKKAKILRDACTGCILCVNACPTNAITMIDR
jgi:ferredoxin